MDPVSVPYFDYPHILLSFSFWDNQVEILFSMNTNMSRLYTISCKGLWADFLTPCLAFLNLVLTSEIRWMSCLFALTDCCVIPCFAVLTHCHAIPGLPLPAKLCSWYFPQSMLLTHRRNSSSLVWRFWSDMSSGAHISLFSVFPDTEGES